MPYFANIKEISQLHPQINTSNHSLTFSNLNNHMDHYFTELLSLVSDQSPNTPSNASSIPTPMVAAEPTTENVIHRDDNNFAAPSCNGDNSSQHNPILRSLRFFDEFAKIKNSMEMFPLPDNDVHLGFPVPQTTEGATDSHGYGSRMTDLLISLSLKSESNIHKLNELVEKAVKELTQMALENEPLWVYDEQKRTQVLNSLEYDRWFRELEMTLDNIIKAVVNAEMPSELPNADGSSSFETLASQIDLKSSDSMPIVATRETVIVSVPPLCIVEIMMDARLWSFAFGDMLSRAIVLESLASGDPSTRDGAVQVMNVEYHGPSPLVPTRQSYFARHCRQLTSNTWIVVDVPLDEIISNPDTNIRRRPSGCLVEGVDQNRYSKVTWIEHVECTNQHVHPLLKPLDDSGFLFGAKRWVNTLVRQCQHLQVLTERSLSTLPIPGSLDHIIVGLDGLLRLRDRMRRSFYGNLSGSSIHVWKPIPVPEAQDVLIRTGEIENQDGVTLTVSVTFWLPHTQERVFGFLLDERNRSMWDMIARGYRVDETVHLNGGRSPDRIVSIIKMLDEEGKRVPTAILQEGCYDPIESYIVYAPVATAQIFGVLDGQGSDDEVSIVPSGFVIHRGGENIGGSVVTALFQLFDRNSRLGFVPPESVQTVYGFITYTLNAIRSYLSQPS